MFYKCGDVAYLYVFVVVRMRERHEVVTLAMTIMICAVEGSDRRDSFGCILSKSYLIFEVSPESPTPSHVKCEVCF